MCMMECIYSQKIDLDLINCKGVFLLVSILDILKTCYMQMYSTDCISTHPQTIDRKTEPGEMMACDTIILSAHKN